MSTNTTSTNERIAADTLTVEGTPGRAQDAQKYQDLSAAFASLPDPAEIARLANEFFAALPAQSPSAFSPPGEVDLGAIPASAPPPGEVPDLPREVLSFPAVPSVPSVPGAPGLPSSPPFAPLNEADFHAIAASLAGATALVPQPTTVVQQPGLPATSSHFFDGEKGGPWAAAPLIPPATEMYSFPGVPAMPSSPPTAPPSGADLVALPTSPAPAAAVSPGIPAPPTTAGSSATALDGSNTGPSRNDPWAAAPTIPAAAEMFSFPRVPGMSVPGGPQPPAAAPAIPATQGVPGTIRVFPAQASTAPSGRPASVAPSAPSEPDVPSLSPEQSAPFSSPTSFPSVSGLFSFPGIPGAQSPPGVPVLPSSGPTKPPAENDLAGLPAVEAGTSAFTPRLRAISQPAIAGATANSVETGKSLPAESGSVESFEFRPDVVPNLGVPKRPLDPRLIRQDFPILEERVHGRQLIWLDNAATTQKPNAVIDRLSAFYRHENSNIHRAAHTLAARATDAYESAREKTRRFLNASSTREIIFVRGTTEGINLVAKSWGHRNVHKDDEVVITWLEHHANIVPWQQLCSETGARLRVAPVDDRGEVILEEYEKLLSPRTRIVSFSHVSNALGTITPAREMVAMAHRHGALVLVDGAQAVSHMRTDVQALNCDFYVFSGHKVFAPTGIGVVYGKLEVLDNMPPWHGGGNMIVDVTFEKTTYQQSPARFEAGTGNIADAVGLGAALDYVEQIGLESIAAHEHELLNYATAGLLTVPGLRLIGTAREKAGVLSFVLDDVRHEDVGVALNEEGIAVRAGHHCAQPILRRMGVEGTVRPSLALYNTYEEIDALIAALLRLQAGQGHRKP
jgi:cysteine desulfurase/selenocysteine lyase